MASFLLFMFLLSQALASSGDYWVQYWVDKNQVSPEILTDDRTPRAAEFMSSINQWFKNFYNDEFFDIYVFGIIILLTVVISFWRSYLFFSVSSESTPLD